MGHGGDLLTYKNYYEGELIDYSSNINPLGFPDELKNIIREGLDSIELYPDIRYRELKKSIGRYLGCGVENVLVGNGAVDIIDLFNHRAKRVIVMTPAFSEYKLRGKVHKKEVIEIGYDDDFKTPLDILNETVEDDDLLILGNPNNPTGLRIEREILISIYNLLRERGAYLLLDEAFFEFAPEDYDSIELFRQYNYRNVGIIRAATKFFAMPGLRLGYGCVDKETAEELEKLALPWRVNSIAELAGRWILDEEEYIKETREYVKEEREYLLRELEKLSGIKVYPTHTNYILIKLLNRNEEEVFKDFLEKGFLIRKCSSFKSLGRDHIRIAIKDRVNNEKIIGAFKQIKF